MENYEQIASYLDKTSKILASWLEKALPELSPDWWENNVVAKLSYTQSNRVRDKKITSLSGLDLAALLRILDHNWDELSPKHRLYYEDRHFLKEMFNIRNKWAHKPIDSYEPDYIFRDFDTIQRFIALISPNERLINEINTVKISIFEPSKKIHKKMLKNFQDKEVSRRTETSTSPENPINPKFACKIFLFPIYKFIEDRKDLYDATRKFWRITEKYQNASEFQFAVGLIKGVSLGAFKIKKWIYDQKSEKYLFEGDEISEFEGFTWYKQIDDNYWLRGQHFVVEFDGKGKFRLIRPNRDLWINC